MKTLLEGWVPGLVVRTPMSHNQRPAVTPGSDFQSKLPASTAPRRWQRWLKYPGPHHQYRRLRMSFCFLALASAQPQILLAFGEWTSRSRRVSLLFKQIFKKFTSLFAFHQPFLILDFPPLLLSGTDLLLLWHKSHFYRDPGSVASLHPKRCLFSAIFLYWTLIFFLTQIPVSNEIDFLKTANIGLSVLQEFSVYISISILMYIETTGRWVSAQDRSLREREENKVQRLGLNFTLDFSPPAFPTWGEEAVAWANADLLCRITERKTWVRIPHWRGQGNWESCRPLFLKKQVYY